MDNLLITQALSVKIAADSAGYAFAKVQGDLSLARTARNCFCKKRLRQLYRKLIMLKPNPRFKRAQMPEFTETCNILSTNQVVVDNV